MQAQNRAWFLLLELSQIMQKWSVALLAVFSEMQVSVTTFHFRGHQRCINLCDSQQ
jgi:hypothetical protein